MNFSAKSKLLLGTISTSGGCCAIAVPVIMSSDRGSSRSKRSVDTETNLVSQEISGGEIKNQEQVSTILESLTSDNLNELWTKINEEFKSKQTNNGSVELPWGSELQNILRNEGKTVNNWEATKQVWEDCKVGQQSGSSKVDYCGYIELKNSNNDEYKIRVSYDGRTSQDNSWEVILVKRNGSSAKYYDGTKKTWEGPRMTWNTNFKGRDGGSGNGWSNLGTTSIKMGK